ncbi:phosphopantetheine-binding protein [Streptomyces achromogenes]|uniref:thioesterase domain-containing protein n=1 Tax=Streptomyces achromogenes TaxID=67255 RepID=UPI0037029F96
MTTRPPTAERTFDPVDSWELSVLEAWSCVLIEEHLTRRTDFFEAGGTSVAATQVMSLLHRSLARQYPLTLLMDHPVFADFVRAVRTDTAQPVPLVSVPAAASAAVADGPRSAWFHAAGGEVVFLRPLAARLPQARFLGIRDTDWDRPVHAPVTAQEFTEKAAQHHRLLSAVSSVDRLAGYSSGAFLAHETTLLRRRAGVPTAPALLVDPPAVPERPSAPSYEEVLARRLGISREAAADATGHPGEWRAALARRSPVGALPEESYDDWLTKLCRISAKGEWALCRYRPTAYPDRPWLVLARRRPDLERTVRDWSGVCGQRPTVTTIDASHDDIITHPDLADVVADWLRQPVTGGP